MHFQMPATNRKSKVFLPLGFCCCFPSDPLNVDVRTPVRGYTPGQTINVKLNVSNESEEDVENFAVELIKVNMKSLLEKVIIENQEKTYYFLQIRFRKSHSVAAEFMMAVMNLERSW